MQTADDVDQEAVPAAYNTEVDILDARYRFQSVDVVALGPDHPHRAEMRHKFLAEHTHADFEIRFFVDGRGLFLSDIPAELDAACAAGMQTMQPNRDASRSASSHPVAADFNPIPLAP